MDWSLFLLRRVLRLNTLIEVTNNAIGDEIIPTVNGRLLYKFLGILEDRWLTILRPMLLPKGKVLFIHYLIKSRG